MKQALLQRHLTILVIKLTCLQVWQSIAIYTYRLTHLPYSLTEKKAKSESRPVVDSVVEILFLEFCIEAKLINGLQSKWVKNRIQGVSHLSTLSRIVSLQLILQLYRVFLKLEMWYGRNPVSESSLLRRDSSYRGTGTVSSFFRSGPLEGLLHLILNLVLGRSNLQSLSSNCSMTCRLSSQVPSSLRFLSISACSLSLRYIWQNSSLNQGYIMAI